MVGRYILHNKLGEGGYSIVYQCTDRIGVKYVCKTLPKSKNTRDRVRNEVDIMKRLNNSPKIVRFHDAGENDEAYFIIQEWCRGGNVKDYIHNNDIYAETTIANIVCGVLRGLVYMHDSDIVHCDIKGANILLSDKNDDADIKIGDFGTAILMDNDIVQVDNLIGTAWFMAPENLSNVFHKTSDIWSLGVMTYQLLSGHMPFNDFEQQFNPRVNHVWKSILTDSPKLTGSKWEFISDDAKDFIKMCLTKNYLERPTARQCLDHAWFTKNHCDGILHGTHLAFNPFI